jgi:hypothetical protein
MRAYSVNYHLRAKAKPDYGGLYRELESTAYWHYLESTWLIATNETPNQVWERISPHIHQADRLLIIEARDNCQGWLPPDAWAWIRRFVPYPQSAA